MLPHGTAHPFAQTMLRHFDKLKTPPRSVGAYPTLRDQQRRFQSKGWEHVEIWDLWDAWCSDRFLSNVERRALDDVEPFDEWEEFMLFARHYFIVHAVSTGHHSPCTSTVVEGPGAEDIGEHLAVELVQHEADAPKRRFGNAVITSDLLGQPFALNMFGLGANSRADTYDVHGLGHHDAALNLPLTGPVPRMCHAVTDLGDFGLLLAGGRGSPVRPLSDCWVLKKGVGSRWESTFRLPVPLFRHAAVRLGRSALALAVGGKTGASHISSDAFVFHPERGWLRCAMEGDVAERTFGAVLCATSDVHSRPGSFRGLLAGGIDKNGMVNPKKYLWSLDVTATQPVITWKQVRDSGNGTDPLAVFGAQTATLGDSTLVCGGTGQSAAIQGQTISLVSVSEEGYEVASANRKTQSGQELPFMIGSSVAARRDSLIVLGGGATCFSMGTFWETGAYELRLSDGPSQVGASCPRPNTPLASMELVQTAKLVGASRTEEKAPQGSQAQAQAQVPVVDIPRIKLGEGTSFEDLLRDRKPVVIEGLQLGDCVRNWTPEYLVDRVGANTEVNPPPPPSPLINAIVSFLKHYPRKLTFDTCPRSSSTNAPATRQKWTSTPKTFGT
jgi:tRNA wybutosine-synthesizing protein 4